MGSNLTQNTSCGCLWGFLFLPTARGLTGTSRRGPVSRPRSCQTSAAVGTKAGPGHPSPHPSLLLQPGDHGSPKGHMGPSPTSPLAATYDGLRVLLQLGLIVRPVRLLQQVRQEALRGQCHTVCPLSPWVTPGMRPCRQPTFSSLASM